MIAEVAEKWEAFKNNFQRNLCTKEWILGRPDLETLSHAPSHENISPHNTFKNALWVMAFDGAECTPFRFNNDDSKSRIKNKGPTPNKIEEEEELIVSSSLHREVQVIEWHHMDKWKYVPLSMISSFCIRTMLYPFTLVKTKIQIQEKKSLYDGTVDCFRKVYRSEGVRGLYKGFWISSFQLVSGIFYVSTYEAVRRGLHIYGLENNHARSLIAGAAASVVGQTIIVPFDVISQHLMIVGMKRTSDSSSTYNPLKIQYEGRSKFEITKSITYEIYRKDGLRGFYRGYAASLSAYVPNSALWWGFYQFYQEQLIKVTPHIVPLLLVQVTSAVMGGWTTCILTNPLDVCRARLQVNRLPSISRTLAILWNEERYYLFTKGLSARMFQSGVFSSFIILGYETIKRLSVKEEYSHIVQW